MFRALLGSWISSLRFVENPSSGDPAEMGVIPGYTSGRACRVWSGTHWRPLYRKAGFARGRVVESESSISPKTEVIIGQPPKKCRASCDRCLGSEGAPDPLEEALPGDRCLASGSGAPPRKAGVWGKRAVGAEASVSSKSVIVGRSPLEIGGILGITPGRARLVKGGLRRRSLFSLQPGGRPGKR